MSDVSNEINQETVDLPVPETEVVNGATVPVETTETATEETAPADAKELAAEPATELAEDPEESELTE